MWKNLCNRLTWPDWEDVQHHKDFINSEHYTPIIYSLAEMIDFNASDSVAAREAPVTEFAPFNIPADSDQTKKSDLEDKILAVFKQCGETCISFATGWVLEELDHPDGSNGKAVRLQGLLGWNSVEDHMRVREMPEFRELISSVRSKSTWKVLCDRLG